MMLKYFRKHIYAFTAGLLIAGFTVYVLLDTFAIERVYDSTANEYAASSVGAQGAATGAASVSESSYSDDNIKIEISEYRKYDTTIYVADIKLSDAGYLKTAFAKGCYGRNIKAPTSETSESVGAILAINGDFYGAQESGYVLRNGVIFRDTRRGVDNLIIYEDGSFDIVCDANVSLAELRDNGAYQVFSFGPALVEDSHAAISENDNIGKAAVCNPRTAIGIIDELHYCFVVADGRTDESKGLILSELADFMEDLGAVTAYNLDGGGSSTMVFNGRVVNKPTEYGNTVAERGISDIVYIGY